MRGAAGGETRIYKYGCGQPEGMPKEAIEQLELEAEYWNALVAIEHEFRRREREVWASVGPVEEIAQVLDRAMADIDALRGQIAAAMRERRAVAPQWREQVQALQVQRKELVRRLRTARNAHWDAARAGLEALRVWRRERARELYRDFSARGLYWGNSLLVRDHYEVARRRAGTDRTKDGKAAQLHPRCFDGTGFWAVRLQHAAGDANAPCTMGCLFARDSKWSRMLQIDPVDFSGWDRLPRSERRRRARTRVRIRVASAGRDPVWLELPIVMHRPLPEGGIVKAAQVIRRRVGTHFAYALSLTVHIDSREATCGAEGPLLAVALGCEMRDGGLRVAVCLDSDGSSDALVLPARLLERFHTIEHLRALRAVEYRAAARRLKSWSLGYRTLIPLWLQEGLDERPDAPQSLSAVAEHWRRERFPGDEQAFSRLEAWRRRDKRLLEWEANLREKCLGFRADLYRRFAHQKAGSYRRVVIHKPVLQRLRQRPMAESRDSPLWMSTRRLMQVAAAFTLQTSLVRAFADAGRAADVVPGGLPVWQHFACEDESGDGELQQTMRCPNCSERFDPDLNTCRHILAWAAVND